MGCGEWTKLVRRFGARADLPAKRVGRGGLADVGVVGRTEGGVVRALRDHVSMRGETKYLALDHGIITNVMKCSQSVLEKKQPSAPELCPPSEGSGRGGNRGAGAGAAGARDELFFVFLFRATFVIFDFPFS